MNKLHRLDSRSDGIFGEFTFEGDPGRFCHTLEHAYGSDDAGWTPKVPPGTYTCVRGKHALHNGVPFQTFEITGVEGHAGILFHAGNFDRDSEGCVLIGKDIAVNPNTQEEMITGSKAEFAEWLARLDGVDSFELEVT